MSTDYFYIDHWLIDWLIDMKVLVHVSGLLMNYEVVNNKSRWFHWKDLDVGDKSNLKLMICC